MENNAEIIVIDDDNDDQEIFKQILTSLGYGDRLHIFRDAQSALEFIRLEHVIPSIIISDINMPGMTGIQLRDIIHDDASLRWKCIPYIFFTTGGQSKTVWDAYAKNAQGYFIKPESMQGWELLLRMTLNYWEQSKKPRK